MIKENKAKYIYSEKEILAKLYVHMYEAHVLLQAHQERRLLPPPQPAGDAGLTGCARTAADLSLLDDAATVDAFIVDIMGGDERQLQQQQIHLLQQQHHQDQQHQEQNQRSVPKLEGVKICAFGLTSWQQPFGGKIKKIKKKPLVEC